MKIARRMSTEVVAFSKIFALAVSAGAMTALFFTRDPKLQCTVGIGAYAK